MTEKKDSDLTRIEDLANFDHEDDTETDRYFEKNNDDESNREDEDATRFEELPDLEETPQEQEDSQGEAFSDAQDSFEEVSFDDSQDSFESFENTDNDNDDFSFESETESSFDNDEQESFENLSEHEEVQASPSLPETPELTKKEEVKESEEQKPPITKQEESFEEVREFVENMAFGEMPAESNPAFGLIIEDCKYQEDAQEIVELLHDYKLISDKQEALRSLERGKLLVARISEFAAIYLTQQLRRFSIQININYMDDIRPVSGDEKPSRGLVTKHTPFQNYSDDIDAKK